MKGIGAPKDTDSRKKLSSYSSKSVNTVYQAETDGGVLVRCSAGDDTSYVQAYTDIANNPASVYEARTACHPLSGSRFAGVYLPVIKDHYWVVVPSGSITAEVYWLSTDVDVIK